DLGDEHRRDGQRLGDSEPRGGHRMVPLRHGQPGGVQRQLRCARARERRRFARCGLHVGRVQPDAHRSYTRDDLLLLRHRLALGGGSNAVAFSQSIAGLAPATTYYYCAIASNAVGTSFGSVFSLLTPAAPTVTTSAATSLTISTATLSGFANPNLDPATGWFRY